MFRGSMVAMVTPMETGISPDVPIDWKALQDLVEFHIAEGSDAIVAVGTTGESATLDDIEHCEVIRQVVRQVHKRIPVIAGTGANSTTPWPRPLPFSKFFTTCRDGPRATWCPRPPAACPGSATLSVSRKRPLIWAGGVRTHLALEETPSNCYWSKDTRKHPR